MEATCVHQQTTGLKDTVLKDIVYIYIYDRILLCHKKNEILSFVATWMGLENIILSEEREIQILFFLEILILYDITFM